MSIVAEEFTIHCDACGYPRTGLPESGRCPECGALPPRMYRAAGNTTVLAAMTLAERARWQLVTVGVILFLICWSTALHVVLFENMGGLTLCTVNVPAPKISVGALIERSINGRPGPKGVDGYVAALTAILALWLMTDSAASADQQERPLSLRRVARWVPTMLVGACAGFFLVFDGGYIDSNSHDRWFVMLAVLLGEAVPTALVYTWLRALALQLRDRHSARILTACIALVPGWMVVGVGVFIIKYDLDTPHALWLLRAIATAYMAVAVCIAALAAIGIIRLLMGLIPFAFAGWLLRFAGLVQRPGAFRRAVLFLHEQRWRIAVIVGIYLWVRGVPTQIGEAYWRRFDPYDGEIGRYGLIGFLGSWIPGISASFQSAYSDQHSSLSIVVGVWLMTWEPPFRQSRQQRVAKWLARWGAVVICGAAQGWYFLEGQNHPDNTRAEELTMAAVCMALSFLSAALVAWYLAWLARWIKQERLARSFVIVAALIVLPIPMLAIPIGTLRNFMTDHRLKYIAYVGGPLFLAIAICAAFALLRLVVALIVLMAQRQPPHLPSTASATASV